MDTLFASSYHIMLALLLDSNVETKSCALSGMNNTVVVAPGAKSKSVVDCVAKHALYCVHTCSIGSTHEVGAPVGEVVGALLGDVVGRPVGVGSTGERVGEDVGRGVGLEVTGGSVGDIVGEVVGPEVGDVVG